MKIGLNRELSVCDGLYLSKRFRLFPIQMIYVSYLLRLTSHFFLPLLLSSRVPNSKSSYIERRKLLVDCDIHTFLNRIQRNLIKIKFSDKMLLSHRTEMDSLKRKCHQICMNLFRFGALFSLYHTSTQSAGDWKTLTEAVLHGNLSQFLQRQYYSI